MITANSTITFGKHNGATPNQLKSIDADYLRWGAKNLKSAQWAAAFSKALETLTIVEEAQSMAIEGIGFDEAIGHLRGMQAQQEADDAAYDAMRDAQEAVIRQWAPKFQGQTEAQIRGIASRMEWDWNDTPRRNFSSDESFQNFRQMMTEYNVAGEIY